MLAALIVPVALQSPGVHSADVYAQAAREFSFVGFVGLAAVTGGVAIVLMPLKAPNVRMTGTLLAAVATASGEPFSCLPMPVMNGE